MEQKTLLSQILSRYITDRMGIKTVCISADGYHFENKTLTAKGIRPDKGLPSTMDKEQFYRDMMALKCQSTESVYFPIYDREIHDPVPNAIEVAPDVQIVIFEGLYLIHWPRIRGLFDYHVYLEADMETMRTRLEERKLKTGGTLDYARKHFERVDSKTMEIAARGKDRADIVIQSDATNQCPHKSVRVTYRQVPRLQSQL